MFNWLYLNWQTERDRKHGRKTDWRGRGQQADKWDVPLKHLGDWHKQPGAWSPPSGADMMTALEMLHDEERSFDFLLAPILTLDHPATVGRHDDVAVNFITLPHPFEEGLSMRVDFWYIDRKSRVFLPIHPTVYPQNKLPSLAPRTWRLVDEDRYNAELAQIQGDGLFAAAVWWDMDGKPPLEECLMVLRQGASKVLLVGTSWDYPVQPPVAYVAPLYGDGRR
ncbi:hypothetical protein HC928_25165 [bacterium]|nr:hypothetical protein [bacterium]